MKILEILALALAAVAGGVRFTLGRRLQKKDGCTAGEIWLGRSTYIAAAAWFIFSAFLRYGEGMSMATLQTADLLATLGILAAVDMRQRVVPNEILIYYLAGQFILGIYGNSLAGLFGIWTTGGITFGILAVVCLFSKGRLGFGDVKLLGAVAVTAGWQYCFVMIFYALFLSFFYSLYLLIWKRKGAGEEFPFVPFLAGGAILQLLLAL